MYGNERLLFIHVPKTGGTWAVRAMEAAGVELIREKTEKFHYSLSQCDVRGRFTFAFVREPISWYGSIYNYRRKYTFADGARLDKWLDLDFPSFLEAVIENHPGHLSSVYETFLDLPGGGTVDFVGHSESLASDLVTALRLAGQDFDDGVVRSFPVQNESAPTPYCPEELKERVLASEHRLIERFYGNKASSGAALTARGFTLR